MDISVIVPIYNVENYIERCLRSLFTQTKTDGVEFILVNDATPDHSMEIARKVIAEYPNLNIRIIEHPENRHIAATRQTGVDAARGNYTIQIDSDDWCEPTMLEDMYAKAIETDADIVTSDYFDKGTDVIFKHIPECNNLKLIHLLLQYKMIGTLWNRLIRRSLYTDNDIRFIEGVNCGEDLLVLVKMIYNSKVISYIPQAYLHYVYRAESITKSISDYSAKSISKVYDSICVFLQKKGIYNDFKDDILYAKLRTKIEMLKQTSGNTQKICANIFPEITKEIFKVNYLPITTKIPLYLASIGLLPVANIIFNLSEKYRSIKQKL